MPGISIAAVAALMEEERNIHSETKLHRRSLRDASDPLSQTNGV